MGDLPQGEKKDNKTSEHLANERTFLAWVRTSIATISLGFVIARFSFWLREIVISTGKNVNLPKGSLSLPIGLGMVAFGAIMVVLAAIRHERIRRDIENDLPHRPSHLVGLTTVAVVLLGVVLIVYMLVASQAI